MTAAGIHTYLETFLRDCLLRFWRIELDVDKVVGATVVAIDLIAWLMARVDIHFSSSMVESLFRGLKSNFLNTEDLNLKLWALIGAETLLASVVGFMLGRRSKANQATGRKIANPTK